MSDEEETKEGGDSFRLMFVTLSMILLAFFILLNSMSTIDESKTKAALGSLLGSFGLLPGANSVEQESENLQRSKNLVKNNSAMNMFKKVERLIKELMAGNTRRGNQIEASFDEKKGEIKIVVSDEFLFAKGEAVISPRLFELLGEVGRMASESGGFVKVIGHTDKTGSKRENWLLSLRRSTVVARHIEAAAHIAKGKICASGASYYMPAKTSDGKHHQAKNRRVEILVTTPKKG
jgi:chemotaxis protein MotB